MSMEIEDSFGLHSKSSERSTSFKRDYRSFKNTRNENSRNPWARDDPDLEDMSEGDDHDNNDDEVPLFPNMEVRINTEKKIPDPIHIDIIKQSSSHKIMIRDVEVYFPFSPYQVQIDYMTSVIDALNGQKNALLQSPTGTGKTLCLLCAVLAWLAKYRNKFIRDPSEMKNYKPIKIYYSSRTHSQIKQVLKELKATCYRPMTSVLGSRDQFCVKSDFQGLTGVQLNAACKQARNIKISEQRCTFYDSFNKNKNVHITKHKKEIYDIEELVTLGKRDRFCPYFLERELKDRGDIVLLPYNYIMDGRIRDAMNLHLENSIMIFDEAHNIEKLSEEGCSFSITMRDMENCEQDFKLLRQRLRQAEDVKVTEEEVDLLEYPIICLAKSLGRMKKEMDNERRQKGRWNNDEQKGKVEAGRNFFAMWKEMTREITTTKTFRSDPVQNVFKDGIDEDTFPKFISLLMRCCEELSSAPLSKGGFDHLSFCASTTYNLMQTDMHIKKNGTIKDIQRNYINSYLLQRSYGEEEEPVFGISLWCLHPGVGFEFIKSKDPRNIILTSGTLAPLHSFESELTIEFPIKLENNHVIDTKTQCYTGVVRKGPNGHPLNFSFQSRDDTTSYREMGATLINIARLVPNGVLVCFASYFLMNKCFEIWESSDNLYQKINAIKPIYKEPKRTSQLGAVMEKYKADAATKGAILCCVCRGKVSEGIDFADEIARAVVIVGIPFPALGDLKVSEKKKFLDENRATSRRMNGGEWYMQQTVRAVNQAVGRVIRNINDYGVVFLCDERFARNDFMGEFPKWIRDNMEIVDKFGFMISKIVTFFRNKKANPPLAKLTQLSQQQQPNNPPPQEAKNVPFMFSQFSQQKPSPIMIREETMRNDMLPGRNREYIRAPEEEKSTYYHSQQAFNARPREQFNPFSSPVQENTSNVFEYFREKNVLSDLKNRTNNLNLFESEDPEEEKEYRGNRENRENRENKDSRPNSQKSSATQKNKKVKVSPAEKGQNSLVGYGFLSASQAFNFGPQQSRSQQQSQLQLPPQPEEQVRSQPARVNPGFLQIVEESLAAETSRDIHPTNITNTNTNPNTIAITQPVETQENPKESLASLKTMSSISQKDPIEPNPKESQASKQKSPVAGGIVCFMCYEGGEDKKMMTSPCGHIACEPCWNIWLQQKAECPQCRSKVRQKRLIHLHI